MANTSAYPLTIDGVRLDTFAYNVETLSGRRGLPKQRYTPMEIPGRDGLAIDFHDSVDDGSLILKMWIVQADVDGNVPANKRQQFETNLDFLLNLFADARGRVIDIRQTMGDGTVRRTDGVVKETMTPDMFGENSARMSVAFMLPNTWWEDLASADFSFTNALVPSATNVTTMTGATAPIDDGRFLVTGPVTNPRVIDVHSGQYTQLTRTIAAANQWLFDAKNRVSRYGAGLTLNSADTAGSDGWPDTSYNGRFKMMTMRPYPVSGTRQVQLQLTGTSGSAATALAVRAKRKFA